MGGGFFMGDRKKEESALAKIAKDWCVLVLSCVVSCSRTASTRPSTEQVHGLMSQVLKDMLFNQVKPKPL